MNLIYKKFTLFKEIVGMPSIKIVRYAYFSKETMKHTFIAGYC